MEIRNRDLLIERFGEWPSFHDAEVYAARFDSGQLTDGVPRLELDIHLFQWVSNTTEGESIYANHTLATLEFTDVAVLDFKWFGRQNVLADLVVEESVDPEDPDAQPLLVGLPSSAGLDAEIRCSSISVLGIESFTPGEHSVYRERSET